MENWRECLWGSLGSVLGFQIAIIINRLHMARS